MRLDTRRLAIGLCVIRVGNGALLLVGPSLTAKLYLGPGGREPAARALARFVGARDVVFGLAAMAAVVTGERDAEAIAIGALFEGLDFAISCFARDAPARLKLAAPSAAAGAVVGAWTARGLAVQRRRAESPAKNWPADAVSAMI